MDQIDKKKTAIEKDKNDWTIEWKRLQKKGKKESKYLVWLKSLALEEKIVVKDK